MSADELIAEAIAIRELTASVVDATDIGTYAIEYAVRNWPVFPLRGKVPAIPNPHPKGSVEYQTCKGECGRQGHGVLDATTDIATVAGWWGGRYAGCNIGARIPEPMFMLDVDPYHGGLESIAELERRHHDHLPVTLTHASGRGDGGTHRFYRRPAGKLSSKRLGRGIDIKTSTGYGVMPPSIHPDTGRPYSSIEAPVAAPPTWLVELLLPERVPAPAPRSRQLYSAHTGPSIADAFSSSTSWSDVLGPHGWRCIDADPDADGARWLHPAATSACSATVRNGCLFVYSTNTPFEITESSDPHGYTRFRAYAVLEHSGDLRAAARAVAGEREVVR